MLSLPALFAVLGMAACGGTSDSGSSGGGGGKKLTLVAYSTPKEAYHAIIPAFQKTPAGKGVTFDQSYGSSGEQSRAVQGGLPADVVAFSLAPDVNKLVKAGLVDKNWAADKYGGFVTNSVVVLAVRKGNPKHIKTWADLLGPGIEVITPNPYTSGGAKWNIMAAYGAQLEQGKTEGQAKAYLGELFKHVPVLDKSAREALQTFSAGKGDVLISYENEAITAQQKGEAIDYVIPGETILIQNPVAVTSKAPKTAGDFVTFLRSEAAQKVYAEKGYRTVLHSLADPKKYPVPAKLFKIGRFGGWSKVNDQFFDPQKGVITDIFQSQGKSTGSG